MASTTAAYATGGAVMALPWVLTTVVLVWLPVVVGRGRANFADARTIVDVAFAVALLVDGPLQIVVSRYVADRLYEGRLAAVAAAFQRGLAAAFPLCAVAAVTTLLTLGLPAEAAVWGGALAAAVGAQWIALSVGNGLCSPWLVLGAVGGGAALGFLLAALFVTAGLGVPGYLFGLISGQSLTLVILVIGIFRALPDAADESVSLLPAFRDYAPLAAAGLAFNASLWVDKLVVGSVIGGETGALHAAASTLAWFATIPCLAFIFVELETSFHRRFQAFYAGLESGASLVELRRGARSLGAESARLLRGAAAVQASLTAFLLCAAGPLLGWLGLPEGAVLHFRLLLVGAGLQALALLGFILLCYFDCRRDALLAALGLAVAIALGTGAAPALGLPSSAGTALGCAVGALLTWHRVARGVIGDGLLERALLAQPFGGERPAPHPAAG